MACWKRRLVAAGVLGAAVVLSRLTRYEIAERSMEPTLSEGDWVLGIRRPARIERGDVIVFAAPTGIELVKRVTAIPGDTVPGAEQRLIGPGELWVTGDNQAAGSIDSGRFGAIRSETVRARLLLRYRPLPFTRIA